MIKTEEEGAGPWQFAQRGEALKSEATREIIVGLQKQPGTYLLVKVLDLK